MPTQMTYTEARANFAKLCDRVADDREVVIIRRRGSGDVALVSASELSSLQETAHLLRSPRNAKRLLKVLNRAKSGKQRAESVEKLRREPGLVAEE